MNESRSVTPPGLPAMNHVARCGVAPANPAIATKKGPEAAGAAGAAAAAVGEVVVTTTGRFPAKGKPGPHAREWRSLLISHRAAMIATTAARGASLSGSVTTSRGGGVMLNSLPATTAGSTTVMTRP